MESIIKDILCSSLLAADRISKHQHAFITKHSTITNLLESTYDWTVSLNNRNPVDILYIDFSKAWIIAFLSDIFQQIKIENVETHISRVISCVPQG